jgi:hypothetical protein
MKYVNYLILCIIIILLSYNIYKRQTKESFTDSPKNNYDLKDDSYDNNNLSLLDNEQTLFNEFCSKIKHINNNYNDNSRQLLRLYNLYLNQINLKKKESNNLLEEVLNIQENIYTNDEELEYRKNYEAQSSAHAEKQFKILSTVIQNLKENKVNENKVFLNVD